MDVMREVADAEMEMQLKTLVPPSAAVLLLHRVGK
jgi:hypothetical protein